ncbi:GGDEF domain-containing protein [Loktanella sp. TSTF-M6]|uniref:diguanylate cyclase n=1 Tax=Loktanella gaetbuli TaxID=2881335 RepID=A0ABS8BW03_9RHOB|nr:GGDEF domain-containing protein [Loktanella gaetbuli]MCB5199915.1 GGDEF domain-containing protein [Loktanella gaetbuli]
MMRWPTLLRGWNGTDAGYDILLRFAPDIDAAYEAEHEAVRLRLVNRMVVFGLVMYNAYNLTAYVLAGDVFWHGLVMRLAVVTPLSFAMMMVLQRVNAIWRERILLVGMINAYLVPVFVLWSSRSQWALLLTNEMILMIVFATTLITLRFRHAIIYTAVVLGLTLAVIWTNPAIATTLIWPLTLQMILAAVFCLYANHHSERRRCEDYMRAYRAADRARTAENSERRMTMLSLTDALTGIPNRRSFEWMMSDWVAGHDAVGLMMIDIDHFKLYNDTMGHPAGDGCLRRVAATLSAVALGPHVQIARIGGEEFAVVMRGATSSGSKALATEIIREIRGMADPHPGRLDGVNRVTISIGLAVSSAADPFDRAVLMSDADAALYQAKRAGRDCWRFSEPAGPIVDLRQIA